MRLSTLLAAAGLTLSLLGTSAMAQTYSGPAERPPASYTADQYVDSRGCIFVRAGYDGQVRWVPRVTRARQQICGVQPTSVRRAAKRVALSGDVYVGPVSAPRKIAEAKSLKPPRGYKRADLNGQLNPRTGVGTVSGREQMRQIWTDTVPRRLIEP